MTSTDSITAVTDQARTATERSVDVWKQGAKTIANQADLVANLPTIDLVEPVTRYFEYVQQTVDLNRDLAIRWAELVTSLAGVARDQVETVGHLVQDQAGQVADLATKQAEKGQQFVRESVEQAKEQTRKAPAGRR